jgi:hypothetical protein
MNNVKAMVNLLLIIVLLIKYCDAQAMENLIRSLSKRTCAAIGKPCKTSADCCHHESDHCVRCFHRYDLIITGFGDYRCACEATGTHISDRPDLGRCDGKDSRTGGCRHRYD